MCLHCDFPTPVALKPVENYLVRMGYAPVNRAEVLAHVGRFGTAEMCPMLDVRDVDVVEALLPGNALHWPGWTDAWIWNADDAIDPEGDVFDAMRMPGTEPVY